MIERYLKACGAVIMACATVDAAKADTDRQQTIVSAARWIETIARGLVVHEIQGAGASIQLVCDPERAFGPTPNGSLSVMLPNDTRPIRIAILSGTGEQAAFEVEDGRVAQAKSDPEQWNRMVDILSATGKFAVVSARDSATFEVEAPLNGACK